MVSVLSPSTHLQFFCAKAPTVVGTSVRVKRKWRVKKNGQRARQKAVRVKSKGWKDRAAKNISFGLSATQCNIAGSD